MRMYDVFRKQGGLFEGKHANECLCPHQHLFLMALFIMVLWSQKCLDRSDPLSTHSTLPLLNVLQPQWLHSLLQGPIPRPWQVMFCSLGMVFPNLSKSFSPGPNSYTLMDAQLKCHLFRGLT